MSDVHLTIPVVRVTVRTLSDSAVVRDSVSSRRDIGTDRGILGEAVVVSPTLVDVHVAHVSRTLSVSMCEATSKGVPAGDTTRIKADAPIELRV